jgi:hypothetical protein
MSPESPMNRLKPALGTLRLQGSAIAAERFLIAAI